MRWAEQMLIVLEKSSAQLSACATEVLDVWYMLYPPERTNHDTSNPVRPSGRGWVW